MKNRKFLIPFTVLAASMAASAGNASLPQEKSQVVEPNAESLHELSSNEGDRQLMKKGNDVFSFVLKRNDSGQMMAWHESHWSHSSHSSHWSHSSHRSHYSGW